METSIKTSRDFVNARLALNLSQAGVARIVNRTGRTVRHWEKEGNRPDPTACRIMEWMMAGFRPPQFSERTVYGRKTEGSKT